MTHSGALFAYLGRKLYPGLRVPIPPRRTRGGGKHEQLRGARLRLLNAEP